MNILLVHGNGGANSRFRLLFDLHRQRSDGQTQLYLPLLPGFEGRPLPGADEAQDRWTPFLTALGKAVSVRPQEPWTLYGHGIGGSLLLEWMARDWRPGPGPAFQPEQVILHAPIGASLRDRFFPKVMKAKVMRSFVHWLIYQRWLRWRWKRKLFLHPDRIPADLLDQFFNDYRRCEAFPLFFDLITPDWYAQTKAQLQGKNFQFVWGERERVVASKYLDYWKRDFPNSQFDVIPGWDHFPMLEQPEDFYEYLLGAVQCRSTNK